MHAKRPASLIDSTGVIFFIHLYTTTGQSTEKVELMREVTTRLSLGP